MKKCSYCGRENTDEATNCRECGTEFELPETVGAETQGEIKTLAIRIFNSRETAEMAAAELRAHGIQCWIHADDCGGMYPSLTSAAGVRIRVRAEDGVAAAAILDAWPDPEAKQSESIPIRQAKMAWGQFVLGILIGLVAALVFYQWRIKDTTVTHYHYNAQGQRDEAWIYEADRLTEHWEDRNLDGAWDHWSHFQGGRSVSAEYDNNFDGKPDEYWQYSSSGDDALEKDTDFNGIPDEFCTYKNHIIQTTEMRPNGSKFATEREVFRNGILQEIWRGDEVVKYDPFFNPISTNYRASNP